ncbi:Elicitin [Plasmopara halstedii]|uniref:Elicitin n=1 Tax=Plasmopara halstedii TaxID=4781 RepID=A0A0P1AZ53_PLAHL|nr:Elicitin [Plasmopara halstedii]CEG47118.1 Elicitin [Plasmopara halstedii]|eukprot:XP_024583487.1 Elicitin [Plasmopara halstedii]
MMSTLSSIILIGLIFARIVHGDVCPTQALMKLSSSINLAGCTAGTGLSMSTLASLTTEQVMDLCENSFCRAFLNEVEAENLGDCTIPGLNVFVESDILDQVSEFCNGSGSIGSMSMGSSSFDNETNVGDESEDNSSNGDNTAGRSTSNSTSNAITVTVGIYIMVTATFMAMI